MSTCWFTAFPRQYIPSWYGFNCLVPYSKMYSIERLQITWIRRNKVDGSALQFECVLMQRSSCVMVDSVTEDYHQLPRTANASNFNNKYIQVYSFTSYFSQKPTKSAKTLADFTCGKRHEYSCLFPKHSCLLPKRSCIFNEMHEFCAICEFCYLSIKITEKPTVNNAENNLVV